MHLRHNFSIVSVRWMEDVSFGSPGIMRTDMLKCCSSCGKTKVKSIKGHWTLNQLQGAC